MSLAELTSVEISEKYMLENGDPIQCLVPFGVQHEFCKTHSVMDPSQFLLHVCLALIEFKNCCELKTYNASRY